MSEKQIFLVLPAQIWSAIVARHTLRDFLTVNGIDDCDFVSDLEVAIDEATTNVAKHAYENDDSKQLISIYIKMDKAFLEIGIRDFGSKMFHGPMEIKEPSVLSESGRGLMLIHALVDEMKYEKVCHGNLFVLKRKLP